MTQRELGALMDVDPSILVTLLNPLEADGYLFRERDPTDRRRHVVTLAGAGERQLERAAQAQRDAEDELFAGLTEVQRAQLRRLVLVIRDQLEHNSACTPPDPAEAGTCSVVPTWLREGGCRPRPGVVPHTPAFRHNHRLD
jgi:MarR family